MTRDEQLPQQRDRTAIVTGAGAPDGIGIACARALGLQGAVVIVTSTTNRIFERAEELRADGIEAYPVVANLLDQEGAERITTLAMDRTGRVDVLVNNAGMAVIGASEDSAPLHATTPEHWETSLGRNLSTTFAMTKSVLPAMRTQSYGRIVMMASVSGPVMAYRGDPAYHAAKAALTGLTRSIAIDYADCGITCNAVAPGWIHTGSTLPEEVGAGIATPVGRSGRADEVAHLVASLAAPLASYTTGQTIVVDGGNSIQEARQ